MAHVTYGCVTCASVGELGELMKLICTRGAQYEYRDPESGAQYFSTSQVLRVLDPDVYAGVDDVVMEFAGQRGTDLHKIFFYYMASLRGLCPVPPRPEEFGGYYDAIVRWAADRKPVPILLEEPSANRKWGVAGTKDFKGIIGGKMELLDLKTTRSKLRIHEAQLNCYRMFEDAKDVQRMRSLYIHEDGTYDDPEVHRDPMHLAALENSVNILRWRAAA